MIRDASSHRRRLLATCHAQTLVRRAEVIDGADHIHPLLQGQRAARQRPASACQRRQALTERRIEPLDIGRVDDPITLRAPPERLDACRRAIHDAAFDLDHASLGVPLHDLRDAEVAPGAQPRTPRRAGMHRIAKSLTHCSHIRDEPIGTDQEGARQRAAAHPLHQAPHQRHVTACAHLTREPQAGTDHHRQGHPDNVALFFDPDLISFHLPQVARLLDQMLLHRLSLVPATGYPTRDRPLVIAKRHDDRLEWTPVGQQRHHQAHRLRRGPQAIECRTFRSAERLVARRADEALVLTRVDTNVALAGLSSGWARQIRAECRCGVHACPPSSVEERTKRSMSGPPFSLQADHTTVKCGATHSAAMLPTHHIQKASATINARLATWREVSARCWPHLDLIDTASFSGADNNSSRYHPLPFFLSAISDCRSRCGKVGDWLPVVRGEKCRYNAYPQYAESRPPSVMV